MPQKKGITDDDVVEQYESLIKIAVSVMICNYTALNLALDMGFAARNQIASDKEVDRFQAKKGQVT